jgi:hypothetical protein
LPKVKVGIVVLVVSYVNRMLSDRPTSSAYPFMYRWNTDKSRVRFVHELMMSQGIPSTILQSSSK